MDYQSCYFSSRKKLNLSYNEFKVCRAINSSGTTDHSELSNNVRDDNLVNLTLNEFESTLNNLYKKGLITKVVNPARTVVDKLFSELVNSSKFGYARVRTVTQESLDIRLSKKGVKAFEDTLEYIQGDLNFWAGYSS